MGQPPRWAQADTRCTAGLRAWWRHHQLGLPARDLAQVATGVASGVAMSYDRQFLLGGAKRNEVLALWEVAQYGQDSFRDPDYVCLYGLQPREWYERGVRILGRTAVECTRDRLGDLIGRDVADVARASGQDAATVLDPFAGSANTLYWIGRHVPDSHPVGFELDDAVFAATHRNLSVLGIAIELRHVDFQTGVQAFIVPDDELVIVYVAPPWGDALSDDTGLDLRRTTPAVPAIIELATRTFARHRLLLATQIHESVDHASLRDVTARFDWSMVRMYEINKPGHNHGLVLGTLGWQPPTPTTAGTRDLTPR
jgi:hypothetical protein